MHTVDADPGLDLEERLQSLVILASAANMVVLGKGANQAKLFFCPMVCPSLRFTRRCVSTHPRAPRKSSPDCPRGPRGSCSGWASRSRSIPAQRRSGRPSTGCSRPAIALRYRRRSGVAGRGPSERREALLLPRTASAPDSRRTYCPADPAGQGRSQGGGCARQAT